MGGRGGGEVTKVSTADGEQDRGVGGEVVDDGDNAMVLQEARVGLKIMA